MFVKHFLLGHLVFTVFSEKAGRLNVTVAAFVNENDSFLTSVIKLQWQPCNMMRKKDFCCVYYCEKFEKKHTFI